MIDISKVINDRYQTVNKQHSSLPALLKLISGTERGGEKVGRSLYTINVKLLVALSLILY